MNDQNFYDFCQTLYEKWLNDSKYLDTFARDFDVDFLPEPYYRLPLNGTQSGRRCLYVLNYNPGQCLPEQSRQNVASKSIKNYSDMADTMARYYDSERFANGIGKNASKRNDKIKQFAQHGGFDSIMCLETFFLHSRKFDKDKFLSRYSEKPLVKAYNQKLKDFLADKAVLTIASIGSNKSIGIESVMAKPWLSYQLQILGIDLNNAQQYVVRGSSQGKTSAAFFVKGGKYISYMMGSNNLPILTEGQYGELLRISC